MWLKTIVFGLSILFTIAEVRNIVDYVVHAIEGESTVLRSDSAVIITILWTIFYALRS